MNKKSRLKGRYIWGTQYQINTEFFRQYITGADGETLNMLDIEIAILTVLRNQKEREATLQDLMRLLTYELKYNPQDISKAIINMCADGVITISEEGMLSVQEPHSSVGF